MGAPGNYPDLASGDQARIVAAQMTRSGGTISFVLDTAAAAAVVDRLAMFAIAPSLGGVESFVTQPITTTHHGLDHEAWTPKNVPPASSPTA